LRGGLRGNNRDVTTPEVPWPPDPDDPNTKPPGEPSPDEPWPKDPDAPDVPEPPQLQVIALVN